MSDEWMRWVVVLAWVAWAVVALSLIYRAGVSLWSRDIWGAASRLSLLALFMGVSVLSNINFLLAFYPVRYWCTATAVLLAIIFRLGSSVERRASGAAGILVFGGLEVYSAVVRYPHYGPIVKGYAAFCLALAIIAVVRRLRRHNGPAVGPHEAGGKAGACGTA